MRRIDLPSIAVLAAFESAARYGSISRAAEELHVTQGAVSRQIRQLEAQLGTALFDRIHGRLVLRLVQATAGAVHFDDLTETDPNAALLDRRQRGHHRPPDRHKFVTVWRDPSGVQTGSLPIDYHGDLTAGYEAHNRDYIEGTR